ncbi:CCC motif membrane protein [Ichthyenterobacterium sp. W332]|uniref:CCC motif membrane protein n=1 Tax=Microcosmobacter mediterraneus TaxID=3075607 RepID=A0ABU2YJ04_9FLAO|nr:CCC motif membrane protein [Ichthyenterobacterium sp. W332]MDT0558156.1 CCC motif membrane protein [Ichthyenterobacterium sp. W332]
MNYNKLPADPSAMTLGIIALCITVLGFCCGPIAFVAVILSIIGLVSANKSMREYQLDPNAYDVRSKSNVSTGRVLSIVGLCLSGLVSLFWIAYYIFYGAVLTTVFSEAFKQAQRNNHDYYEYEEWEDDSSEDTNEIERDTIHIDSVNIDNIRERENDSIK